MLLSSYRFVSLSADVLEICPNRGEYEVFIEATVWFLTSTPAQKTDPF